MNEQLTQTMIQAERFFKKFKFIAIGCIALIVGYFAYDKITTYYQNTQIEKANNLYNQLLQNPDEKKEIELSKINPNLYSIYLFYTKNNKEEAIKSTNDKILKKIYEIDTQNEEYLKDLSDLKNAFKLLKDKKIEQARIILDNIPSNSQFFGIATSLKHYQGIGKWEKYHIF